MLGLSEDHYTHSEVSPTHGSGQGAGDSSNQREMLSSIILKIMHDTASEARFQDPYEKERKVEIANTAFVDDTSGYQNTHDKKHPNDRKYKSPHQQSAKRFHNLGPVTIRNGQTPRIQKNTSST
jgi:hypothetical protein